MRWSAADAPETEWTGLARARRALDEIRAGEAFDPELINEIEIYLQGFDVPAG
jgi:hypothetical protein